jgi:hypothetical protein
MGVENITKKGVDIVINGENHKARFTMAALAYLAEKYGSVNKVLEVFKDMISGTLGLPEIDAMADLLFAGLMHEGSGITVDVIMDTLEVSDIVDISPQLLDAFTQSMGTVTGGRSGNPPKA